MSSQPGDPATLPAQSSLSFTQGFLLGQLSVVLVLAAFIKFFIFGEAPPPPSRGLSHRSATHRRSNSIYSNSPQEAGSRSLREKPSTSNVLRPVPSSSTNTRSILRKTYYSAIPTNPAKHGRLRIHHSSHQPESLDWFNVLIAQTIAQYRQTAYSLKDSPTSSILNSLTAALNNPEKKPAFIDKITVTDISLGEEFPIFSNCRIIAVDDPNSDGGRLQALMDVDLSDDNLSIAIETQLLLNYPKPCSAILPVALSISVVRFSGTLCISLVPASTPPLDTPSHSPSPPTADTATSGRSKPGDKAGGNQPRSNGSTEDPAGGNPPKTSPKSNVAFSFLPDYRLDLSVRSLIGSRSRLQDVPKVAQLVEARVQAWFEERVVEPRVQVVGLPDLWPRMGRTGVRTGDDAETASNGPRSTVSADIGGSARHEELAREPEALRFRGLLGARPPFDVASRTSSFNVETGDLRSRSMTRQESSGDLSDQLHIPGSLPEAVTPG
ncbi:ERMES complex subunit MMM1 [Aspergillus clavatus NRRL 1]|uniref:Maintenance of mitochondrial morphology protein 1 n=1 Tax=Aspergillus clavatus (strain ATCC 1007 / CBS 513.65 / DSM 816 / NCTC 3887 / NRRL 1 / QM 1276 / 107) TaxID=344612 RepID=MMM1_ASPCL|nr:mitochondrion biogenesis protein Mmm1, putative [Aspergillus clavatus NRRL 1]A1CM86.1 RecName: Full=Maintenance of mitochondrial morphology protein 1 [Aspergillus clavatus NRRL 1]EAW08673.1 mitochondrion biogenesis protein Mmm1, putative [Aspergillus clavatus NRRL 1]